MLVAGIKSKPVYSPLSADPRGRFHLMLSVGDGRAALQRVIGELREADPSALERTRVLCVGAAPAPDAAGPESRGVRDVRHFDAPVELLAECRRVLDEAVMGTRLYVAGPESFIGLAMKIALEYDMNTDEIRAEEVGSRARRVYCVHCRAVAEEVRTNIVACGGCERWLLVRDHYSRRLAAYMGVMVDAERPGELPSVEEIYS